MLRLYSYSTCEIYLDLQTDHNSDIIEVVVLIRSDKKTGGPKLGADPAVRTLH